MKEGTAGRPFDGGWLPTDPLLEYKTITLKLE
jgi:hypothetical protein